MHMRSQGASTRISSQIEIRAVEDGESGGEFRQLFGGGR